MPFYLTDLSLTQMFLLLSEIRCVRHHQVKFGKFQHGHHQHLSSLCLVCHLSSLVFLSMLCIFPRVSLNVLFQHCFFNLLRFFQFFQCFFYFSFYLTLFLHVFMSAMSWLGMSVWFVSRKTSMCLPFSLNFSFNPFLSFLTLFCPPTLIPLRVNTFRPFPTL